MASIIAIRWILALLGLYACALLFASRTAMSVAIVSMTRGPDKSSTRAQLRNPNGSWNYSSSKSARGQSTFSSSPAVVAFCADSIEANSSESSRNEHFYSRLLSAELFIQTSSDESSGGDSGAPEFDWNEKLQVRENRKNSGNKILSELYRFINAIDLGHIPFFSQLKNYSTWVLDTLIKNTFLGTRLSPKINSF